uniref:Uncharacterized protein n=1 Tax=Globodera rostochiensis TaxID=31243 RepID=A0A914H670_GLORO
MSQPTHPIEQLLLHFHKVPVIVTFIGYLYTAAHHRYLPSNSSGKESTIHRPNVRRQQQRQINFIRLGNHRDTEKQPSYGGSEAINIEINETTRTRDQPNIWRAHDHQLHRTDGHSSNRNGYNKWAAARSPNQSATLEYVYTRDMAPNADKALAKFNSAITAHGKAVANVHLETRNPTTANHSKEKGAANNATERRNPSAHRIYSGQPTTISRQTRERHPATTRIDKRHTASQQITLLSKIGIRRGQQRQNIRNEQKSKAAMHFEESATSKRQTRRASRPMEQERRKNEDEPDAQDGPSFSFRAGVSEFEDSGRSKFDRLMGK